MTTLQVARMSNDIDFTFVTKDPFQFKLFHFPGWKLKHPILVAQLCKVCNHIMTKYLVSDQINIGVYALYL